MEVIHDYKPVCLYTCMYFYSPGNGSQSPQLRAGLSSIFFQKYQVSLVHCTVCHMPGTEPPLRQPFMLLGFLGNLFLPLCLKSQTFGMLIWPYLKTAEVCSFPYIIMLEKTSLGYVINGKPIFPMVLHLQIGYMCLNIAHSHGDGRVGPSLTFPFLS